MIDFHKPIFFLEKGGSLVFEESPLAFIVNFITKVISCQCAKQPIARDTRSIKLVETFLVNARTALTMAIITISISIPFSKNIWEAVITLKVEITKTIPSIIH